MCLLEYLLPVVDTIFLPNFTPRFFLTSPNETYIKVMQRLSISPNPLCRSVFLCSVFFLQMQDNAEAYSHAPEPRPNGRATTRDDRYATGARAEPASSGFSTRGLHQRLLIPPGGMMNDMRQQLAMLQQAVTRLEDGKHESAQEM